MLLKTYIKKTVLFLLLDALIIAECFAGVIFGEPEWKSDLNLCVPLLLNSTALPIEMPRAEAYLISAKDGKCRLEDRFNTSDIWIAMSLRGRWIDVDDNILWISRLTHLPPQDREDDTKTRSTYYASLPKFELKTKSENDLFEAVSQITPVEIIRAVRPRRANRKNLEGLWMYETSASNTIVCAFRPRSPEKNEIPPWYSACLEIAPGEDYDEALEQFDSEFLDRIYIPALRDRKPKPHSDLKKAFWEDKKESAKKRKTKKRLPSEAELIKDDYRSSVANYNSWHWSECDNITIIDNLDNVTRPSFISALTNNLPLLQKSYSQKIPSPLSSNDYPTAIRIFGTQEEYLSYVGEEQKWTAALWSPVHRELVLYLNISGQEGLLRSVQHEAFHQYLAYASSMMPAAAWFNEGHAELFEHSYISTVDGTVKFTAPADLTTIVKNHIPNASEILPALIKMDYPEFYYGSQEERRAKYALAWSIAYFIEIGAPEIRFRPYETLRADYVKNLIKTHSMHEATAAVLSEEKLKDFIDDWKTFWNKQ
jgi:hypothetical protein